MIAAVAWTVADYLTTMGVHKDRLIHVTPEIRKNAEEFVPKVNAFMERFGKPRGMSSGYRDPVSNSNCNGAKYSWHCRGKAIDIFDLSGDLGEYIINNESVLEELGLWAEDPKFTKDWVHLQSEPPRSGNRIFKPR